MKISKYDDEFQSYLVEGASVVGKPGIPMLLDLKNTQIPNDIIPFEKARHQNDKRKYIHFYMHDKNFSSVLTATKRYIDLFKEYDGVISPDCSLLIGQSECLQQTNTYFNRAVGYYLQKNGIPVIPNIRWSDESSFEYCFLGVPKHTIVSVSTHGCIRTNEQKKMFKAGLKEMINVLEPTDVLVHGFMPDKVFEEFKSKVKFHRYKSQFERTHEKEGA